MIFIFGWTISLTVPQLFIISVTSRKSCQEILECLFCLSPAFRALLQIRAVRRKPGALSPVPSAQCWLRAWIMMSTQYDTYSSVLSLYKTWHHSLILIVLSLSSELRLCSPWVWAHLAARGFERSWCRVPRPSICTSVRRDQLLWEPEWREQAAQLTWPLWRQLRTEEQSQQVTGQVNLTHCMFVLGYWPKQANGLTTLCGYTLPFKIF